MNKRLKKWLFFFLIIMLLLVTVFSRLCKYLQVQSVQEEVRIETSATQETGTFLLASPGRSLTFPADFGPHPDYQSEWWYYTGNLQDEAGRHFGLQLTFFRRALLPPDRRIARSSAWGTEQAYMAHFALSDIQQGEFHAFERFSRGAVDLAGARADPFRVWLDDWKVEEVEPGVYHMQVTQDSIALDLLFRDTKGPILHGESGYSQKGTSPGNASHYYSQTRLETGGTLRLGEEEYEVSGASWMDHEFSTSALSPDQVGWDWFSIQLDDGSELMVFNIRRADGSIDPFSSGTFIPQQGKVRHLTQPDFKIKTLDTWNSPHSGGNYPSRWRIEVPSEELSLELIPHQIDQELNLSYTYWEGAVRANGYAHGRPLSGNGYVELTGYAGSIVGEF